MLLSESNSGLTWLLSHLLICQLVSHWSIIKTIYKPKHLVNQLQLTSFLTASSLLVPTGFSLLLSIQLFIHQSDIVNLIVLSLEPGTCREDSSILLKSDDGPGPTCAP